MKTYIVLFVLLVCGGAYAQPLIQWQRPLGGSRTDCAYDIKQTFDGGYITVGHTTSSDGDISAKPYRDCSEYWVVKLGPNGELEWEKTYGGSADEHAYAVVQVPDGGYIVAGYGNSTDGPITFYHGGNNDCWILKIDRHGILEWQRTYGGSKFDVAYDLISTRDGGFVFVGATGSQDGDLSPRDDTTNADLWIVKIDSRGEILWQKTYGGSQYEFANSVREIGEGGYIVSGITTSQDGDVIRGHGSGDAWVMRLGVDGSLIWQASLGGSQSESANAAFPTNDGGFIIAGEAQSSDGDVPVGERYPGFELAVRGWLVKLTAQGNVEWSTVVSREGHCEFTDVFPDVDGGYTVAGYSSDSITDANFWILKFSPDGVLQWQQDIGGSLTDVAEAICQTRDGGYALTGSTFSSNGDVIIKPPFHDPDTTSDFWVVKLTGLQCGDKILNDWLRYGTLEPFTIIAQTPGPVVVDRFDVKYLVRSTGNVSVCIYNTLGELILNVALGERTSGQHTSPITVGSLPSGVYTYHFELNGFVVPGRFIVNR